MSEIEENENNSDTTNTTTAIVPVEQREVNFYGDTVTAALVEVEGNSLVVVPIRPICDYLGLTWSSQLQRTRRDEILNEALISVFITNTEKGRGKGRREVICIHLEQLPGWLVGIDASRVKPELRDKVLRYRRECFKVLWRAFQSEMFSVTEEIQPVPKTDTSELERIREMGLAIARMAEQQIELANRVDIHENRLNTAAHVVSGLIKRVSAIEEKVAPGALITETQSEQISDRVKALADYLNSLDPKKKPPYGAIFGELYRRFGVSDYRHIKRGQFDAVMQFLNDWRESAGTGRVPDQLHMFGEGQE